MNLAPDSYRYLAMGAGEKAYTPFNRRVLFPFICGDSHLRWKILTYTSLAFLPLLVGAYVFMEVDNWYRAFFAIALMAGMPSMQFWAKTPILTDAPAMCIAVLAALLPWPYNLILVCIGGLGRETVPLFAAIYALNPILLLGLIPVGIWSIFAPKGKDQLNRELWLDNSFETAFKFKQGKWLNPEYMILPWGGALIAFMYPSILLFTALAFAYSQLLVATDWSRLYIWAAPVVCLQASNVDEKYMIPLLIFHWFNKWRGPGY